MDIIDVLWLVIGIYLLICFFDFSFKSDKPNPKYWKFNILGIISDGAERK